MSEFDNSSKLYRVFYDWEFEETPTEIAPISLGIITEDNKGLYLIFKDYEPCTNPPNEWLQLNVLDRLSDARFKSLHSEYTPNIPIHLVEDDDCASVLEVFFESLVSENPNKKLDLWGYWSSYDEYLLSSCFGTRMNVPDYLPGRTWCLTQTVRHIGLPDDYVFPIPNLLQHNSLFDAVWTKDCFDYLYSHYGRQLPAF